MDWGSMFGGLFSSNPLKELDQVGSIAQNLEATGLDDFAAFDAAQLAESGIGEGQMTDILGQAGVADADFVAADAANLADVNKQTAADMGTFDVKGFAKDLGSALGQMEKAPEAPKGPSGSIAQPIQRTMGSAAAPASQPVQFVTDAMNTIQSQNMGTVPTIQDILKMRQTQRMV